MANGWAPDGAVEEQIEDSIKDAVAETRSRLLSGESLKYCEACGEDIPSRRRLALPGVRTCVTCQAERDFTRARPLGAINRRGSKDGQLQEIILDG